MGPRGARVRCPQCARPFVVLRQEVAPVAAPAGAGPEPELPFMDETLLQVSASDAEASRIAAELLDSLADHLGGALVQARSRGRVLAEFGPDVMKAFDEYRARLGDHAAPAVFRAALKERWGVDLVGGLPVS